MRCGTGLALALLTTALGMACGNAQEEPPARQPSPADDSVVRDTIGPDSTAGDSLPAPAPVELPADFPADFPIAPESTIIAASSEPDPDGIMSRATIVTRGRAENVFAWYHGALGDMGWIIASEGRDAGSFSLRATQGESYVELTVRPDPAGPESDRIETRATIWKTER